jgi:imidazolonepropionase-like amidohydrolase
MKLALSCIALAALTIVVSSAQQPSPSRTVVYEGARVIVGDGSAPIDDGVFVVQNGRFTAVGRRGATTAPAGAQHVSLSGKTVMPAMINVHVHMGYEGYTSWGAANYTDRNVLDHLQREAFYGTAVAQSVGTSPTEAAIQFQRDQEAGTFASAARFLFAPGMAPPNGGPDAVLRVATSAVGAINEVSTPDQARAAVRRMALGRITHVKLWFDDRGGTYPKLTPEVTRAIIDEAHTHGMTVHAHAIALADQKFVVSAGADVLVHMAQRERVDDELVALLKEKRPYWATVIGLGDPTDVCNPDPFFEQALPASVVAKIRATTERRPLEPSCGPPAPNAAAREETMAYNFPRMIAGGARIVLGTDTGVHPGHTFGSGEHVELARWVQLGLSPMDAIVAATSRPAQLMGLSDMGTVAVGKRASFIVLDANPLDNIRNTRRISAVYLDGAAFDRDAMLAKWSKADTIGQQPLRR